MSIQIRKVDKSWGIYDGYNDQFINAVELGIDEDAVREYVKEYPFPRDSSYYFGDLVDDLQKDCAFIVGCRKKTANYIADLVSELS